MIVPHASVVSDPHIWNTLLSSVQHTACEFLPRDFITNAQGGWIEAKPQKFVEIGKIANIFRLYR